MYVPVFGGASSWALLYHPYTHRTELEVHLLLLVITRTVVHGAVPEFVQASTIGTFIDGISELVKRGVCRCQVLHQ